MFIKDELTEYLLEKYGPQIKEQLKALRAMHPPITILMPRHHGRNAILKAWTKACPRYARSSERPRYKQLEKARKMMERV